MLGDGWSAVNVVAAVIFFSDGVADAHKVPKGISDRGPLVFKFKPVGICLVNNLISEAGEFSLPTVGQREGLYVSESFLK